MSGQTTRRKFLETGFGALAAAGGAAIMGSALGRLAFAEGESDEPLVVIFLRGAMDGLSFVPPLAGADRAAYEAARPNLKIPLTGDKAALKLDDRFGLHPAAKPLYELYQAGRMAFVHAAGLTSDTRSHFDAQLFMELGAPGAKNGSSGWLARFLLAGAPNASFLTATAVGTLLPNSLQGFPEVAVINSLDGFNLNAPKPVQNLERDALRRMYAGNGWLARYGRGTLDAIDAFEAAAPSAYKPAGRDYPRGDAGGRLRAVAQIIKMNLGLRAACVDVGGWDTHKYQGDNGEGNFANMVGQLSQALAAFDEDMRGFSRKPTVVVMSEFGRRVKENASRGTDHGHGNVMMLIGGAIAGKRVYGRWPGLANEQLYERADLAVTTDYRSVLSELLGKRYADDRAEAAFPGLQSTPLGVVNAG